MKVLRVQGDYTLRVEDGGTIFLDTGPNLGEVRVTGDLIVEGTTTTIESTVVTINDKIITLNDGEVGPGVGGGGLNTQAGIEIDRGGNFATLLWDEAVDHYDPTTATNLFGTWVFKVGANLTGIQTNSIDTNAGVLGLINNGSTGYVTVTGTANYERNILTYVDPGFNPLFGVSITDDDRIPNMKAVGDYVSAGFSLFVAERFGAGDTIGEGFDTLRFVGTATWNGTTMTVGSVTSGTLKVGFIVTDGVTNYGTILSFGTGIGGTGTYLMSVNSGVISSPVTISAGDAVSKLTFKVDNVLRAQIDTNGVTAGNMNMTGNSVSSTSGGITLNPVSGQVLIDGYMQLAVQASDPSAVASNDMLYHKTIGAGDSGLYFRTTTRNDELVSKRRAILFGMIF